MQKYLHKYQYKQILSACERKDAQMMQSMISTLMRKADTMRESPRELKQLYELCYLYSMTNRYDELYKIINRFVSENKKEEMYSSQFGGLKWIPDIEIEVIDIDSVELVTQEPEVAEMVDTIRDITTIQAHQGGPGRLCWKTKIPKQKLTAIKGYLKKPISIQLSLGKKHLIFKRLMIIRQKTRFYTLLCTLLASLTLFGTTYAQEHHNYLLKKVGNLYILNVGVNDGIKEHAIYNLSFEKAKRLPFIRIQYSTKSEFFGTVQVTQVFPEYCVVRIISKVMEGEPEGNRIVLIPKGLPDIVMDKVRQRYSLSSEAVEMLKEKTFETPKPENEPDEKPIVKILENEVRSITYKPYAIGFTYFRDFDQIAQPVTENLISEVNDVIYTGDGIFNSSFSSNGGISFIASKMMSRYLSVEGGLSIINHNSVVNSVRSEDSIPPEEIISVNNWDFDIQSRIVNWSLTMQISQFSKSLSHFTGQPLGRPYVPRLGIGINYAAVDVTINHQVLIDKLLGEETRSLSDKKSMGGFWGLHAVAGVDYYYQVTRFFAEINYNTWFSDKFDANFPFRIGASINF